MDWKLELIQIPVADIDRAKAFYTEQAGFNADQDHQVSDEVRFVQLTPPGSPCSIALTSGVHEMRPGSVSGLQLVVEDADDAREQLLARGMEVGDVQVRSAATRARLAARRARASASDSRHCADRRDMRQSQRPKHRGEDGCDG
jgi:predicted enzyme related to lactoylglutathione lyase